jgi:hypothetical protein
VRRWIFILSLLVSGAFGQGISFEGKPQWGFNSTVVPQRINRLAVLVANNTDQPFDGAITLQKEKYDQTRLGARLVQPVYVTPFTRRWVYFYCYNGNDPEQEQWQLQFGRGLLPGSTLKVERAKAAAPARMFLREAGSVVGRRSRIASFADDEFPTSVTGLDALHSLVMAHAPEWEPARKQALRDWVYRGGVVHLFQDARGNFPAFAGTELGFLNRSAEVSVFGAGRVVRHAKPGYDASHTDLEAAGYPAPRLEEKNTSVLYSTIEQSVLLHLKRMILPDHNWGLMFFVAMVYLILVGPLNYVFARRWANHYLSLGAFLLCVLIFGLIFMLLGRRGFGEESGISYVTYVEPLDANRSDLTQWTNVFSTKGRTVDFAHGGAHRVFSTCQESEAIPGTIINGVNGVFQVEMPIFSSMSLLVRTAVDGPALSFTAEGDATSDVHAVKFRAGEDFPETFHLARMVYRGRIYTLKKEGDYLVVDPERKDIPVSRLLDANMRNRIQRIGQMNAFVNRKVKQENKGLELAQKHEPVFYMLIARVIGSDTLFRRQITDDGLPANQARLFLMAESPDAFHVKSSNFKKQSGVMILHQDILL